MPPPPADRVNARLTLPVGILEDLNDRGAFLVILTAAGAATHAGGNSESVQQRMETMARCLGILHYSPQFHLRPKAQSLAPISDGTNRLQTIILIALSMSYNSALQLLKDQQIPCPF